MSTCTRKVLTVLAEKGHKADFVLVDLSKGEQKSPEHLARQPFGVVPSLDDNGFTLYESGPMCRYLDETLPGTKLTPSNPKDHALMEQWMSVATSYFTSGVMKVVFQEMFGPMRGLTPDQAVIKEGRESACKCLDVLEKHLAGKDYLVPGQFTLADIAYMPYIEYLFACKNGDIIAERPNVAAWWNRISERPSWAIATGKAQAS